MNSTLRWMPLDIPDYLNDTGHLTTLQHGAYMLLLMHYWRHGPLPDDDEQLAAITKTDAKTWRAIRGVIRRFFHNGDNGGLHQKRADKERDKAQDISAKRRAAASDRWSGPPNGGANGHANAYPQAPPEACKPDANAYPKADASAPHTLQPRGTKEPVSEERKEDILKKPSFLGTAARAERRPDALEAVLSEVGVTAPEPEPGVGAEVVQMEVQRAKKALSMRIPYGEVRSVDAQLDALKAQPAVVGSDASMGLRWRPADPIRTPAEQYAEIMGCPLAEAEARLGATANA